MFFMRIRWLKMPRRLKTAIQTIVLVFILYALSQLMILVSVSYRSVSKIAIVSNFKRNTGDKPSTTYETGIEVINGSIRYSEDDYTETVNGCLSDSCMLYGKRKKKVYLTIGILSTLFLETDVEAIKVTINSLLKQSDYLRKDIFIIVICLSGLNRSRDIDYSKVLYKQYPELCDSGDINIIQTSENHTQNLNEYSERGSEEFLPKSLVKANIDRAFLFSYCSQLSQYFIEMSVGDVAVLHYDVFIKTFVNSLQKSFFQIQFTGSATTGMLFPAKSLHGIVNLLNKMHNKSPTYMILLKYGDRTVFGKKSIFRPKEKITQLTNGEIRHELVSDLLKEKLSNPPAQIHTDMKTHEKFAPEFAYDRDDFTYFWTSVVDIGNVFQIIFPEPIQISRIVVTTGNYLDKDQLKKGILRIGRVFSSITKDCDSIVDQWVFVEGMVDTQSTANYTTYTGIVCLSVIVKSRQREWLMIRDIFVNI